MPTHMHGLDHCLGDTSLSGRWQWSVVTRQVVARQVVDVEDGDMANGDTSAVSRACAWY